MTAHSDLVDFDRQWTRHLTWKSGGYNQNPNKREPQKFTKRTNVGIGSDAGLEATFPELPTALRKRVLDRAERAFELLVELEYEKLRAEMVQAARDEAQQLLRDTAPGGRLAMKANLRPPMKTVDAATGEVSDAEDQIERLGAALEAIDAPPEPEEE